MNSHATIQYCPLTSNQKLKIIILTNSPNKDEAAVDCGWEDGVVAAVVLEEV